MTQERKITQNTVIAFKEIKCIVENPLLTYILGSDGFIGQFLIQFSKN